jgi:hypothetical protein
LIQLDKSSNSTDAHLVFEFVTFAIHSIFDHGKTASHETNFILLSQNVNILNFLSSLGVSQFNICEAQRDKIWAAISS